MKILFGPAGAGGNSLEGIKYVKQLNLEALEIEFVYGVKMSNKTAKDVGDLAKKLGISLSVHAPYYINLCSEDKSKIEASKKRIIDSCERAHYLNARYVVFHAAFYGKLPKEKTYELVKQKIEEIQKVLKEKKITDVVLCPETTGKPTQFGDIDELVKLSKETDCGICIDFAHIKARNNGKIDYDSILDKIKNIKELTMHFSGIEYSIKGERKHKLTSESEIKDLLIHLKKHNLDARIINESPDPIGDSLKSKRIYEKL